MAFCPKCGTQHDEGAAFCANCGNMLGAAEQPKQEGGGLVDQIKNTKDHTDAFDPADIQTNNLLSLLSYLGILILIPIFLVKKSRFSRFHANQGLLLIIANAAVYVLNFICGFLTGLWWPFVILLIPALLLSLGCTALAVLGIINAVRGKAKELPFIGKFKLLRW